MGRLLSDLASGLQLGAFSINRQSQDSAARNRLYQLAFRPTNGYKHALLTRLVFDVTNPEGCSRPVAKAGTLSGATAATYATVASWTVTSGRNGRLLEISADSTDFSKTNWQLVINDVLQFTAFSPRVTFTLPFTAVNRLPSGATVVLQAASTDGTSITARGLITATECFEYIFKVNVQHSRGVVHRDMIITQLLADRGLDLWLELTNDNPLLLEVSNVNGYGGEVFSASADQFNMDEKQLALARRLLTQVGGFGDRPLVDSQPLVGAGAGRDAPFR